MTNTMQLNRRRFMLGGTTLLATTALSRHGFAQTGAFIVGNYGGSYGERFERLLDRPIAEKHKLQLQPFQGDGPSFKAKLLLERNLPRASMDIVHIIDADAFELSPEDVLETLDPAKIPNLANIIPGLATPIYAPWAVAVMMIVYDPKQISTPPTSYADLWKPEFAGKVGLADILAEAYPSIAALVEGKKVTETEGSLDKLLELKKAVQPRIYPTHEALAAAFKNGEIAIAAEYKARAAQWNRDGLEVEAIWPSEGALASSFGVGIPKRAGNKEAAYEYVNTMLSPEIMGALCRESFYSPATTNAALTDEEMAAIAIPQQEEAKLNVIDPGHQAENIDSWLKFWDTDFKA
ncbi:MAG: ABC transporter substrate-binding protein [Mesorhizobium sp.]